MYTDHTEKDHLASEGPQCSPPSPELFERIRQEVASLRGDDPESIRQLIRMGIPTRFGLNDAVMYPSDMIGSQGPQGIITSAAPERLPTGTIRVIVVLVNFTDKKITRPVAQYNQLFFGPTGSVREYYSQVTNGAVTLTGQIAGPFNLPRTMAYYANGEFGIGAASPNARNMARDAAMVATGTVDFSVYDNDHDGFVDAFIIVHAGQGAEQTGNRNQIWSHKWILAGGAFETDRTKLYTYLTVPEDARLGVCVHELGHLLFGFPDLYDTDSSSAGIGRWCVMSSGCWNGGGNRPCHPSAYCKVLQKWVSVIEAKDGTIPLDEVKSGRKVIKIWATGKPGPEYFLLEYRLVMGYDSDLPGQGLLIWHIDESVPSNRDETHPKVKLMQADGRDQLRLNINTGDIGDPFPGSTSNKLFNVSSNPNSKPYGGGAHGASVRIVSVAGNVVNLQLGNTHTAPPSSAESGMAMEDDQVPLARL